MRNIQIVTILIHLELVSVNQSLNFCDPSYCSHEGQCFAENNLKTCQCIGENYFRGPRCTEVVDNCHSNSCQNGGQCQSLVGQFMCHGCQGGYGGLWCDVQGTNIFQNMALYFNHYGYYSAEQNFLIILEEVGSVNFSVELVGDNYVIDSFETAAKDQNSQWTYSTDVTSLVIKFGIHYYNDLPFKKGFYRLAQERFWDLGMLKLTLRSYDTETASELFYLHVYDLLILKSDPLKCVPQLKFAHGADPLDPLLLDIARFNNFEPLVQHRCSTDSRTRTHFKWHIFNSVGNKKLYTFGSSYIPLLKVPPYRLWFKYHGEVMSSYSLVVAMTEKGIHSYESTTETRCFILVLPKPVKATVRGGPHREIGVGQKLIVDGSTSRDFALAPHVKQDLLYRWDCVSLDDPQSSFCQANFSTSALVEISKIHLKINARYQFNLVVQSKVNLYISDKAQQQVVVVQEDKLFVGIKCLRNCLHYLFSPDHIIHLEAQCAMADECSPDVKFDWTLGGVEVGSGRRCLYTPKELDTSLTFKVVVWDKGLKGSASTELTFNSPPAEGSCSIKPSRGVAFETQFHVECINYEDVDSPLSYQYKAADFPLERINDPQAMLLLPECQMVAIVICDQWEACIETQIIVDVTALPEPESLCDFLTVGSVNINALIDTGHTLDAMILVKSLLKYLKTEVKVLELFRQLETLSLLTLLEVEQWLIICHDLNMNLLPLDNRKALASREYIRKLTQGLKTIIEDQEILYIQDKSYANAMTQILDIMREFSKPWETQLEVQTLSSEMVVAHDPLAEHFVEICDFDIQVLGRIANWLETSRELHNCFDLLSSQSVNLYYPQEDPITIGDDLFKINVYSSEETSGFHINMNNFSIQLDVQHELMVDLQKNHHSENIILHVGSMVTNNFWWYPDNQPISTNLLFVSAHSQKSSSQPQMHFTLNAPIATKFNLQEPKCMPSKMEFEVVIEDHLHMPIYALKLPSNAALVVKLQKGERDILLEIGIGHKPRGSHFRKSANMFRSSDNSSQIYFGLNRAPQTHETFIAVLATEDVKDFPLSITMSSHIIQCLYWNWASKDPQWTSNGCTPKISWNISQELECECNHLSIFAAKSYTSPVKEVIAQQLLLQSLPFNWYIVAFYATILLTLMTVLAYNFYRIQNFNYRLVSDANNEDGDMQVLIYTGSHWNSTSSANFLLRFISEKGPYSVTIYQNPGNPQLIRNSLCEFRLNSRNVRIPLKLTITNDLSGRYPSWYCHKISVFNRNTKQFQLFIINKWNSKQTLEVMPSSLKRSFQQKFQENLANFYVNWFQFQPILGPVIFTEPCCFQRSCVWISQFMVSLCFVACYYGPTTMDTYEEERQLYHNLHFNITKLLLLPLVCFLSSTILRYLFYITQS